MFHMVLLHTFFEKLRCVEDVDGDPSMCISSAEWNREDAFATGAEHSGLQAQQCF